MPYKTLQWWEQQYLDAIGYAIAYKCQMSFSCFCAARHLEEPEMGYLREHLEKHSIGCD